MRCVISSALLLVTSTSFAADWSLDENPQLAKYFESQVGEIESASSLLNYTTLEQWQAAKPKLREQLFDMLGLSPLPERTPLRAEITGVVEEGLFRVEKIHFQSSPGLYVTGNLYLPKVIDKPLPTILYVCGHARVKKDDVSFGNKTAYHHHGAWFARNGYACLMIDTLQLGEIEGIHHGTYRHDRWWWNSRGYTPAGVEAWNCMRALDYLETRPEVDAARFGVTGRSGGGAYSWWISATDERIKCAVPVAGITSLRNHVVDGCVEGHCDCMYMVNTYRWDYATVAALVAPRPLLISNSDKDRIFPLDGVVDVHRQVRHIYDLHSKPRSHGLHITEGPHKDTQELRVHAFRWFNRFLKNDDTLIELAASKYFEPDQLRVFHELPADQKNTTIDETFVPARFGVTNAKDHNSAVDIVLKDPEAWQQQTIGRLRQRCFGAWPDSARKWKPQDNIRIESVATKADSDYSISRIYFDSQEHVTLHVDIVTRRTDQQSPPRTILQKIGHLEVFHADDLHWNAFAAQILNAEATPETTEIPFETFVRNETAKPGHAVAVFAPRGIGPHAYLGDKKKLTQIERRFQLIGTTADTMRIWDLRRAVQVSRKLINGDAKLALSEGGDHGGSVLLASLFDSPVSAVRVRTFAGAGPYSLDVLNLQKMIDPGEIPTALAALRCPVFFENSKVQPGDFVGKLTADQRWTGYPVRVSSLSVPSGPDSN